MRYCEKLLLIFLIIVIFISPIYIASVIALTLCGSRRNGFLNALQQLARISNAFSDMRLILESR